VHLPIILCGVIIDDNMDVTGTWDVSWQKAKPKKGKMIIQVKED